MYLSGETTAKCSAIKISKVIELGWRARFTEQKSPLYKPSVELKCGQRCHLLSSSYLYFEDQYSPAWASGIAEMETKMQATCQHTSCCGLLRPTAIGGG